MELFAAQIEQHGKVFKGYERPKKFSLLSEDFTIDNGMLTPKMSLKRQVVMDRYGEMVDELYAS